jgi:hypothetical protein
LPNELLFVISDFDGSLFLSHTCRRFWYKLQGRHASHRLTSESVARITNTLQLRSVFFIRLVIPTLCQTVQRYLPELWQMRQPPSALSLSFLPAGFDPIGNVGAVLVLGVKKWESLRSLTLDLSFHGMGPSGARALGRLWDMPCLTFLSLHLTKNNIGDSGVKELVKRKGRTTSLYSITLDLCCNQIGDAGASALAGLKDVTSLGILNIDLSDNFVKNSGAMAMADLKNSASLRTLRVLLGGNDVGDVGACALGGLKDLATLRTLTLNLSCNQVGDDGIKGLAELKNAVLLHDLNLDLSSNQIGDAGAQALAGLGDTTSLGILNLNLNSCVIGDVGAQAMARLKDAAALHILKLELGYNRIRDTGVQAQLGLDQSLLYLNIPGQSPLFFTRQHMETEANATIRIETIARNRARIRADGWAWASARASASFNAKFEAISEEIDLTV